MACLTYQHLKEYHVEEDDLESGQDQEQDPVVVEAHQKWKTYETEPSSFVLAFQTS